MPKRPRSSDSSSISAFMVKRPGTSSSTFSGSSSSGSKSGHRDEPQYHHHMDAAEDCSSTTANTLPPIQAPDSPNRNLSRTQSRARHFVHGLQTFVGGLSMSQPRRPGTAGSTTLPSPTTSSGSRPSSAGWTASNPPTPLVGHDELAAAAPLEPRIASMTPGVSPGWQVGVTNGMQAWATTPIKDDEGWSPLQSFPGRKLPNLMPQSRTLPTLASITAPVKPSDMAAPKSAHLAEGGDMLPPIRVGAAALNNNKAMPPPASSSTSNGTSASGGGSVSPTTSTKSPSLASKFLPSLRKTTQQAPAPRTADRPRTADLVPVPPSGPRRVASSTQDPARVSPTLKKKTMRPSTSGGIAAPSAAAASRPQSVARSQALAAQASAQPRLPVKKPSMPLSPVFQSQSQYSLEDFEILDTLGTGTFGRVLLVKLRSVDAAKPEAYFAMKVLAKSEVVRLKQVEHINSERAILSQVHHPFIVNLFCTFQDSKNCYMLMEYVVGGEVFSHLRRAGRFSADVTRFYIATLVLAIDYMHKHDVVYRDLKPENLLLDPRGYIKITDFGFAKHVDDRTWTLCGTPEYLAPEIIESKGHGSSVDWWALGILMYEMLAGFPPYFDEHPFGTYEKILKGKLTFPSHIDATSRDLIRCLLTQDVSKRLGNLKGGADDVKRHFWFHGVDWKALEAGRIPAPIVPKQGAPGTTENFSKYAPPDLASMPGLKGPAPDAAALAKDPFRSLFTAF